MNPTITTKLAEARYFSTRRKLDRETPNKNLVRYNASAREFNDAVDALLAMNPDYFGGGPRPHAGIF